MNQPRELHGAVWFWGAEEIKPFARAGNRLLPTHGGNLDSMLGLNSSQKAFMP
jgi:hypothetical protein